MLMANQLNEIQRNFLSTSIYQVESDHRFLGLGVCGSIASGQADEFSDLDLLIAVDPPFYKSVLEDLNQVASRFGSLLSGFTGEHVGDRRIYICLYGPPLLHVDLKFVLFNEVHLEHKKPLILYDRDNAFTNEVSKIVESSTALDFQWLEDRFWVWIHYGAVKIARGELFETLDFVAYLRKTVLAPLAFNEAGESGFGVRKIEQKIPQLVPELQRSTGYYDKHSLKKALQACVDCYERHREGFPKSVQLRGDARQSAKEYLETV